jgi:hypothetical protein
MKQDIRRTRKVSEVRPVLYEIAALSSQAPTAFIIDAAARPGTAQKVSLPSYSERCAWHVEIDEQGRLTDAQEK